MALTVYHEARGEPISGQHAVAHVIMNRVADPRWPSGICAVTRQAAQFSWIGEVNPLPDDAEAWANAVLISRDAMEHRSKDNTGGATNYHSTSMSIAPSVYLPYWVDEMTVTRRIGNHIFYRRK